uniref:Ig-like domain-containing protein n=1 Tax=Oryzias latipes TaxID=8090 RepID=A0A3P9K9Y4_ORYLA
MWLVTVLGVIYLSAAVAAQDSNTVLPTAVFEPPQPNLQLQSPFSEPYSTEKVVLKCTIDGSSDWNIKWNRNHLEISGSDLFLSEEGSKLTITTETSAVYTCRGEHKIKGISTKDSNTLEIKVKDLPIPTVELLTNWRDLFESERVEMSCEVGVSDWTFSWYKDGVPMNYEMPKLSFPSVTQSNEGKYQCKILLKSRGVSSELSNSVDINIYAEKAKPHVTKSTAFEEMYPGESIQFNCEVRIGTDWNYMWYLNGREIPGANSPINKMDSISHSNAGQYFCKAKRGQFFSEESDKLSLQVSDPPIPAVKLLTNWKDVFESERVEMSCEVGVSDWTFSWYKDGVPMNYEMPKLSIPSVTQINKGKYQCKVLLKSRRVSSGLSNSVDINIYAEKAKPHVTKSTAFEEMYPGESIQFNCEVRIGTDWNYLWYLNGREIPGANSPINKMDSISHSNGGQYFCKAKRGQFFSEESDKLSLQVSDPPIPAVKLLTNWKDVFESERVEMSCEVGVSDWTFSWYKDGVPMNYEMPKLSIPSVTQINKGKYQCKVLLKSRKVSSGLSNSVDINIYEKAKPNVNKSTTFEKMYPGESIQFNCEVTLATDWNYIWYLNGTEIPGANSPIYKMDSISHSNGGQYFCKAKRGQFFSEESDKLSLQVSDPPKPRLQLLTPWLDLFEKEKVEMSCGVNDPTWTFTWYKDDQKLTKSTSLIWDEKGSKLTIGSIVRNHHGSYACKAHLTLRGVRSELSIKLYVKVYESLPKPQLAKNLAFDPMYVGESVSFTCKVSVSSGWKYKWYKDSNVIANSRESLTINLGLQDKGEYWCNASRDDILIFQSNKIHQDITEIPVPLLKLRNKQLDVFPKEMVELSCKILLGSGWTYTWYKDGKLIQADKDVVIGTNGATMSFRSDPSHHKTQNYTCKAELKDRSVHSNFSSKVTLMVYDAPPNVTLLQSPEHSLMHTGDSVSFRCDVNISSGWKFLWFKDGDKFEKDDHHNISSAQVKDTGIYTCQAERDSFRLQKSQNMQIEVKERPQADVILLTGWAEVFSTDTLVLMCKVKESEDKWNYTWFREKIAVGEVPTEKYTVTPQNDPDQSHYTCKGIRTERPTYSVESSPFKTKNLLLKRRILLSVSGCLFFGIILAFLGCIYFKIRKPVVAEERPEENELFLTMKKQLEHTENSCPLVEYITDAALNERPKKENDDIGLIRSDSTELMVTTQEDQAVMVSTGTENGGAMISFQKMS